MRPWHRREGEKCTPRHAEVLPATHRLYASRYAATVWLGGRAVTAGVSVGRPPACVERSNEPSE